jgi:hypothetical protein
MKLEQRLYGCGCKGAVVTPAPVETTTTTTVAVPTVQPTSGS